MNITICGSVAFIDEMIDTKKLLEEMGHAVKIPLTSIQDEQGSPMDVKDYYSLRKQATAEDEWIWDVKAHAIRAHFEKVEWSDAILVLNYDKNDIPGYVGANTLMEMGLAFHLGKKIYLLLPIPQQGSTEEILGMKPTILHNNMLLIST